MRTVRAEEHHAEDELEEDGGAEVAVFEELDVDDGVGVVPLPEDEPDEEDDGGDEGDADADVGANQSFSWPLSRVNSSRPTPMATRPRPMKSTLRCFDASLRAMRWGGSSTMRLER